MKTISIQYKSTDPQRPMNGKLLNIGRVKSIGYSEGVIFVNFINDEGVEEERQFKLCEISLFFES